MFRALTPRRRFLSRYNFPNGWFVGGEGGGLVLSTTGFNQIGAFRKFALLRRRAVRLQLQERERAAADFPCRLRHFEIQFRHWRAFHAFDNVSGTLPGYSAHAGLEYQPAPNVSLSFDVGYTQQSGSFASATAGEGDGGRAGTPEGVDVAVDAPTAGCSRRPNDRLTFGRRLIFEARMRAIARQGAGHIVEGRERPANAGIVFQSVEAGMESQRQPVRVLEVVANCTPS